MNKDNSLKILFVEDLPSDMELAVRELRESGLKFTSLRVEAKEEYLNALQEFKPDIIISDYALPSFDGMQALKLSKAHDMEIPFIILTGSMNEETAVECMKAGADDYVIKEHLARISFAVKEAIERKRIIRIKNETELALEESKEATKKSELKFRSVIESANDAVIIANAEGKIKMWNKGACNIFGYTFDEIIDRSVKELMPEIYRENHEKGLSNFVKTQKPNLIGSTVEVEGLRKDGSIFPLSVSLSYWEADSTIYFSAIIKDITARKREEEQLKLFAVILEHLNRKNEWQNLIRDILKEIKSFTEYDAVGIRLREGEDYPYYVQNGFSADFVRAERYLCEYDKTGNIKRDSTGKAYLECMCGNIISGRTDTSKPFFTVNGSFWTNSTTKLLATTTEKDRQARTRNRCNGEGYESVALIPIRSGETIVGLLQLNDKRTDRFTLDTIKYFEKVASSIGIAYIRMRAEEKIKESEENYRNLVDNSLAGVYKITLEGDIIFGNKTMLDILEYDGNDYTKLNIKQLYKNPADRETLISTIRDKREIKNFETELISFKGRVINVIINSKLEGNILTGILTDITEKKRAIQEIIIAKEKAEEMSRLKSSFLANMSHEIRTPLNGIMGFSDIIQDEVNLEEVKNMARIIHDSGKRLLNTLNQILELSSLESKTNKTDFILTDINNLINDTTALFSAAAQKKNLELSFESDVKSLTAYTEPDLLCNTLNNLVNNAIIYTKQGSVKIIAKEEIINKKECVVIDVIDTGIGIDKKDFEIIFDEFRQVSEGWGRHFEGTGLGLSICKKYMSLLGGTISVTSKPGVGSDFRIVIPKNKFSESSSIALEKDEAVETSVKNNPVDVSNREVSGAGAVSVTSETGKNGDGEIISEIKPKILYIEDDMQCIQLLKLFLKLQYDVDVVTNGPEGVEKTKKNKYDLILLDINLGKGMTGIEALTEIKKNPHYKDIPVIALTALAFSKDEIEFRAAGCTDYISKPYRKEELREKVKRALKE